MKKIIVILIVVISLGIICLILANLRSPQGGNLLNYLVYHQGGYLVYHQKIKSCYPSEFEMNECNKCREECHDACGNSKGLILCKFNCINEKKCCLSESVEVKKYYFGVPILSVSCPKGYVFKK